MARGLSRIIGMSRYDKYVQIYTELHIFTLRYSLQNIFLIHCARFYRYRSNKLLSFDVTLHRLKFPSSDRYIPRVS